jgi:hypothetical protein
VTRGRERSSSCARWRWYVNCVAKQAFRSRNELTTSHPALWPARRRGASSRTPRTAADSSRNRPVPSRSRARGARRRSLSTRHPRPPSPAPGCVQQTGRRTLMRPQPVRPSALYRGVPRNGSVEQCAFVRRWKKVVRAWLELAAISALARSDVHGSRRLLRATKEAWPPSPITLPVVVSEPVAHRPQTPSARRREQLWRAPLRLPR